MKKKNQCIEEKESVKEKENNNDFTKYFLPLVFVLKAREYEKNTLKKLIGLIYEHILNIKACLWHHRNRKFNKCINFRTIMVQLFLRQRDKPICKIIMLNKSPIFFYCSSEDK